MISTNTVFVLGAGASSVYGFPMGQTLCENVITNFADKHQQQTEFLNTTRFKKSELDHFRNELQMSGQSSVDAFLEYRPEFLEIGKAAMAVALVGLEKASELFTFKEANWMRYLIQRMGAQFSEFGKNSVSFITFNYDRSLEQFLFQSMRASYGKSENECAEVLHQIPIIHLHGQLGYLPWQKSKGRKRGYDSELTVAAMQTCIEGIKVVHEDIDPDRDRGFNEAFRLLKNSRRIYLLGFGYSDINMARLQMGQLEGINAHGTGFGLTPKECNTIHKRSYNLIEVHQGMDCIGLLRNVVEWD